MYKYIGVKELCTCRFKGSVSVTEIPHANGKGIHPRRTFIPKFSFFVTKSQVNATKNNQLCKVNIKQHFKILFIWSKTQI